MEKNWISDILEIHRKELISVSCHVKEKLGGNKGNPLKKIEKILDESFYGSHDHVICTGDKIRKVHDDFGWAARHKNKKIFCCSGALYRTSGYINIETSSRNGERGPSKNVHIEHTIPVNSLMSYLSSMGKNISIADFKYAFLRASVCTAFSEHERLSMSRSGVKRASHDEFQSPLYSSSARPFIRYSGLASRREGNLVIYNILHKEPIKIEEFTLENHMDLVKELYGDFI